MHVLDDELTLRTWRIRAKLTEGRRAAIFAGQGADGTPVIIKSLKDAFPSRRARAALHREHRLLAKLRAAGVDVVEPLALEEIDGHLALVLRDVGAGTLDERIQRGPMEIDAGLQIALAVTQALGAIHAQDVIHKDVKPANILVAPDGARAWLIDFEVSSDLGREAPRVTSRAEGTLAYIAPEQTGRMNRRLDRRADLYSLGAVLYELLTGRPPFLYSDGLEMVHAHLARPPTNPCELEPAVPEVIGERSAKRVLTLSYEPGRPLHDLGRPGVPQALRDAEVEVYLANLNMGLPIGRKPPGLRYILQLHDLFQLTLNNHLILLISWH